MMAVSALVITGVVMINGAAAVIIGWFMRGVWRCGRDMKPKPPPSLPDGNALKVHPSG